MTVCNHSAHNWNRNNDGAWTCRGCGESFQAEMKNDLKISTLEIWIHWKISSHHYAHHSNCDYEVCPYLICRFAWWLERLTRYPEMDW